MENLKKVTIYTDGACSGNPGPGGYGAILIYNGKEKEISGGEKNTTNNKMEMMAVIKALEVLKEKCDVEVYSDSAYVVNSINNKWVYSWKKNNWIKSDKTKAKNIELWEELIRLISLGSKESIFKNISPFNSSINLSLVFPVNSSI